MAKNIHAVALGQLGGSVSSPANTAAARLNAKAKRPHHKGRPKGAKDKQPRKRRSVPAPEPL